MIKLNFKGIRSTEQRWERGTEHDSRSEKIGRAIGDINFQFMDDSLGLNFGGDGDNGEELLYALDIYFDLLDKGRI